MAKKILIPLDMNGVKVRNLESLKENFDLEKVTAYFVDGTLLRWLDGRYYEEEAERVRNLSKDDANLGKKLCEVFGVEYKGEAIDVEDTARRHEVLKKLKQLTTDEEIISHAAQVAFTQEDLAYLLNADETTIYLCGKTGEKFSIPASFENRKYIGILGKPEIKVNIKTFEELKARGITFENVILPWDIADVADSTEKVYQPVNATANDSCMKELRDTFEVIFGERGVWEVVNRKGMIVVGTKSPEMLEAEQSLKDLYGDGYREWGQKLWNVDFDVDVEKKILTPTQKKMFLKMVCEGKYTEDDLIFIRVVDDFSSGFAFTKDSFCIGGELFDYQGSSKFRTVFYKEITDVEFGGYSSDWAEKKVPSMHIRFKSDSSSYDRSIFFNVDNVQSLYTTAIITENILWQIGRFLEFVKD